MRWGVALMKARASCSAVYRWLSSAAPTESADGLLRRRSPTTGADSDDGSGSESECGTAAVGAAVAHAWEALEAGALTEWRIRNEALPLSAEGDADGDADGSSSDAGSSQVCACACE